MNATRATLAVMLLALASTSVGIAQSMRATGVEPSGTARADQMQSVSPRSSPLYAGRDTWYEYLLKHFNPADRDYGAWMEQHRRALLDASLRNPYFRYSATVTLGLLALCMLCTKLWVDHRRAMWITSEMMTDLYNHDAYSRRVAREAIDKYNQHIERCNRAIEATENGLSPLGTDSEVEHLRSELQTVTDERDSYRRERDVAKNEIAEKERLMADMSLRLDALAKKSEAHRSAVNVVDVRNADQKLVEHINTLQEQLYTERRENKRLKGA